MTYNHAFTIGFAVGQSEYDDWAECLANEKELRPDEPLLLLPNHTGILSLPSDDGYIC